MPITDNPLASQSADPYVVSHVTCAGGTVHRAGPLTQYLADQILDDLRRIHTSGRLELILTRDGSDTDLARLLERLQAVEASGVTVIVRRAA